MMIWLLALLLLASLGALGFRQGGIRVAFSLMGILLGIALAGPLGKLLRPPLMAVGVKNPVLLWVIGLAFLGSFWVGTRTLTERFREAGR